MTGLFLFQVSVLREIFRDNDNVPWIMDSSVQQWIEDNKELVSEYFQRNSPWK